MTEGEPSTPMRVTVPRMRAPPKDGRTAIERPGFSYLPRFITPTEADALIAYFGRIVPIWERRHHDAAHQRPGTHGRRLTRPVYWLGAWQFACLGYYAEPNHREGRCLRAEPFPTVMRAILDRLMPALTAHDDTFKAPPNSCLINYYGRTVGDGPPRDYARLRMHRDGEPGPVAMFSIGQPGLLEFVDPAVGDEPELSVWTRNRSVNILSGPEFKDRLYHRITEVRHGREPAMTSRIANFETRRVSVSFRHVPETLISDLDELPIASRAQIQGYVEELAQDSAHYSGQMKRIG